MGPCHVSTSAALPTATIRSPSTASASACGRVLSTVQIFALVMIRSAAGLDCAWSSELKRTSAQNADALRRISVTHRIQLSFSPLELRPQNIKERSARHFEQFHFIFRFAATLQLALQQWGSGLSTECEE